MKEGDEVRKIIGMALTVAILLLVGACAQPEVNQLSPVKLSSTEKAMLPKIDHIVVVVEENRSAKKISGNADAPFLNSLMRQGANLTNYHAIEHPSQPNYLDLFSGSNQGVTNDQLPAAKFKTANLASELLKNNKTFAGYSEDLPAVGFKGISTRAGGYARKHNPWVNFTNVTQSVNQPFKNFPRDDFSKLPTVSFVIPNLKNDMHDGSIAQGDQWLKENLAAYVKWAHTHNSLLIVTWDEDDHSQNNQISTFFVGPMVKAGRWDQELNHYHLLRTIEDLYGLNYAGKSRTVKPITGIWK